MHEVSRQLPITLLFSPRGTSNERSTAEPLTYPPPVHSLSLSWHVAYVISLFGLVQNTRRKIHCTVHVVTGQTVELGCVVYTKMYVPYFDLRDVNEYTVLSWAKQK